jgi:TM2 domain-containing membrane protein YozV
VTEPQYPVQPVPYTQPMPYAQPGYGQPGYAVPFVPIRQKDVGIAYLLWFFLGALGAHQFYLGKIGRGIFYLLTAGGFLIGIVIDLFTLASQTRRVNAELASGVRR